MRSKRSCSCVNRKRSVVLTPEEKVRQAYLSYFIDKLGYPRGLISLEISLHKLPHLVYESGLPARRLDLVVYEGEFSSTSRPLLLAEFKKKINPKKDLRQLLGYQFYVQSSAILLADNERCVTYCLKDQRYHSVPRPLSYKELQALVNRDLSLC